MNILNHALWGATIGRTIGMPLEGVLLGAGPDLIGVTPLVIYKLLYKIEVKAINFLPPLMKWYYFCHNWFVAIGIIILLAAFHSHLWILGFTYFWHVFGDAFLHTDMAVPFLYPFWKGKIQGISAADNKWIQVVDLLLIISTNIFLSVYKIKL